MKGVILAGGTGSRLMPLTKAVNKHLLPVGPYPMIYWSIMKLEEAGITDILLITQKNIFRNFINFSKPEKSSASQSHIRFSQPHPAFPTVYHTQSDLQVAIRSFCFWEIIF